MLLEGVTIDVLNVVAIVLLIMLLLALLAAITVSLLDTFNRIHQWPRHSALSETLWHVLRNC